MDGKFTLLIIFVFFNAGLIFSQSEVYVSPTGDDDNPGTIDQPFKTIQQGVKSVESDGTVYVRGGIYREEVTVYTNGITIEAYSNESPVIKGSVVATGWEPRGDFWKKFVDIQPQQVFVDGNNPLQQIGMPSEYIVNDDTKRYMSQVGTDINDMAPGRFWWESDTLYIWLDDSSDPNTHEIEVSQNRRVLNLLSSSGSVVKGITIEHSNCNTFAEQDAAVKLGVNCVMDSCTVQWCDFGGISMNDGAQVLNCEVLHNGATGLNASSCGNFLIKNTRIAYSNYRNFYSQWHAGAFKGATYAWGTIENCEIDHNNGAGLWFDYCHYSAYYDDYDTENLYPIIIRYNYFHDNGTGNYDSDDINNNASILIEVSEQAYVYNNIIDRFQYRGIWASSAWNSYFVNNVIANGETGSYSYGIDGGASYVDWAWEKNNVIANNILYNNNSSYQIRMQPDDGGTKYFNNICQNNLVYKESGTIRMVCGGDIYYSVSDWQDNTEFGNNSLSVDPLFADTMFHLSSSSPCIDAGLNVITDTMTVDYENNPRIVGGTIDMGVYEVQTVTAIRDNEKESEFSLYPNPTTGIINVKSELNEKYIFVKIYDAKGRLVLIDMLKDGVSSSIDLSNRPKGIYFISIDSGGVDETYKVVLM
ncbi:MAG: T9SS type A sorting domain-containing protein [Chlorobi bacterium]|nr:T9SS type A sorting domain-containing protein [Chlorobiota bacterium]